MTVPVLSVILVDYNDRRHLKPCLESVLATLGSLPFEVFLVDNASTDGSAGEVEAAFSFVRVIRNKTNPGFGVANNQAVRESAGEFLLFLNTDTILQPGAISALLESLRSAPDVAAVGPLLFSGPGRVQVSFGKRLDFIGQFVQKFFLNPFYKMTLRGASRPRETGWLSAACLLCRRAAFEAAGRFDERFFIYFEDIDLCVRMRSEGGRLLFIPRARVFHEGGATTGPRPAVSRLEYRKSQMAFYVKHASRGSLRFLRGYLRLSLRLRKVVGRFKSEEGRALWTAYRNLLRTGDQG